MTSNFGYRSGSRRSQIFDYVRRTSAFGPTLLFSSHSRMRFYPKIKENNPWCQSWFIILLNIKIHLLVPENINKCTYSTWKIYNFGCSVKSTSFNPSFYGSIKNGKEPMNLRGIYVAAICIHWLLYCRPVHR